MRHSYFALSDKFDLISVIDRKFNPYRHSNIIQFNEKPLTIFWTKRVEQQLKQRSSPLYVEMQLYFSCVVKKRVLFHEQFDGISMDVNDQLAVVFRPVEAKSCNPEEFAANYPERRQMNSIAALKMKACRLYIDCKHGQWSGEFYI